MSSYFYCHNVPGWDERKCCTSCHDDWEGDYADPLEFETPEVPPTNGPSTETPAV